MAAPWVQSLYEETLKGCRGWSAGSNGQVDPPYHHGPLVEWYLLGFRVFGGVWGGLGSIPSDFGQTGLTPDLGEKSVKMQLLRRPRLTIFLGPHMDR